LVLLLVVFVRADAANWPAYRELGQRTGATQEQGRHAAPRQHHPGIAFAIFTRDASRYRTHFPTIDMLAPNSG